MVVINRQIDDFINNANTSTDGLCSSIAMALNKIERFRSSCDVYLKTTFKSMAYGIYEKSTNGESVTIC